MSAEQPQFEGALRNPEISEDADRLWDRLVDTAGKPADAARRIVPEFKDHDKKAKLKKFETVAEKRQKPALLINEALSHGEGIKEYLERPENKQRVEEAGLDKTDFDS